MNPRGEFAELVAAASDKKWKTKLLAAFTDMADDDEVAVRPALLKEYAALYEKLLKTQTVERPDELPTVSLPTNVRKYLS